MNFLAEKHDDRLCAKDRQMREWYEVELRKHIRDFEKKKVCMWLLLLGRITVENLRVDASVLMKAF